MGQGKGHRSKKQICVSCSQDEWKAILYT